MRSVNGIAADQWPPMPSDGGLRLYAAMALRREGMRTGRRSFSPQEAPFPVLVLNSHHTSWRNARQGGDRVHWYSSLGQRHLGRQVGRICCDYFVDLFWLAHVLELMLAEIGETQFRGKTLPGELSGGG